MTLRHMKIYSCVFRLGSITKAAEELHLAQPSVSLAVKELEEYYGIRLFERIGRRIYSTESGKVFYGYATHIVSLFEEMEKRMKNWDNLGTMRVGSSITIGTHILPQIIKRYHEKNPGLTIEGVIGNSSDVERHILDNTVDLGLIETQPEHPDICAVPFMKDSLCAIVSNDHTLASYEAVTLAQLAKFPFFMREKGSAGREILEAAFALSQLTVRPAWESRSTQAIARGVAEGLGVAVLPYLLVKRDIEEKTVKRLELLPPLCRDLNIIYHKSKYLTPNMHALIDLCCSSEKDRF